MVVFQVDQDVKQRACLINELTVCYLAKTKILLLDKEIKRFFHNTWKHFQIISISRNRWRSGHVDRRYWKSNSVKVAVVPDWRAIRL